MIKAILYTIWKHRGQKRKITGYPYAIHPLRVGYALYKNGYSKEVITAGILHDTVEDTNARPEDIKRYFGEDVARIISTVSKNQKEYIPLNQYDIMSIETKAVKYYDVLDNLRDTEKHGLCVSEQTLAKYKAFINIINKTNI